jgi:hypothetical protein
MNETEQLNGILRVLNLPPINFEPKYTLRKEGKQINTMSKQMMALDQIREGGFIVGSIDANAIISFSGVPRIHTTATDARTECKRLAAMYPGKAFIFVKLAGAELVPQATPVSI